MIATNNHTENAHAATAGAVDLQQLSLERRGATSSAVQIPRHLFSRYLAPLGLLGAFAGLFVWSARDSFLPAQKVTVTPVVVTRAEVQQEGTPLFQAAGWVEPRPTAVDVASLVPGIVEELFVVEGQLVERGQAVAKLMDVDAKLSLQQAQATLRLCDADVKNAEAVLAAARTALERPNEMKAALADAESVLADIRLTLGNLPYMIDAAKTRQQLAADNVASKEQAGQAIAGRVLREARAELAATESALAELQSRGPTLEMQASALERKRSALAEQLELMSEQKRAVSSAEAALASAHARQDQAQLSLDAARLALERTLIRAPIAGRVLTLDARPGMRLAGMDPVSQHSGAVISLYDPKSLQVRVDVRLEDVSHVRLEQPVTIETAALSTPLTGRVSWMTTRADIQKNTLQVKVAINDPPDVITPEMLAQVTFLAAHDPRATAEAEQDRLRMLVPRTLVVGTETGASVWVADALNGVARRQNVQLGRAGTDQLVEVTQGLDPTVKLIVAGRESLSDGARIRVVGEDQSFSTLSHATAVRPTSSAIAPGAGSGAQ